MHVHENQLETHEVINGTGTCINNNVKINYSPGIISIFPMNIMHEVTASDDGLYLFAKFFPALC
jgi:quercetin dioxygenase-like cupin family protein